MNLKLAFIATKNVFRKNFAIGRSKCQRFIRLNLEEYAGLEYDEFRGATANEAARKWAKSKYARPEGSTPQVGELAYWYGTPDQPEGHTAIRVLGNRYAENSFVHYPGKHQGKGFRPLSAKRIPDVVVAIP